MVAEAEHLWFDAELAKLAGQGDGGEAGLTVGLTYCWIAGLLGGQRFRKLGGRKAVDAGSSEDVADDADQLRAIGTLNC